MAMTPPPSEVTTPVGSSTPGALVLSTMDTAIIFLINCVNYNTKLYHSIT
jgi:hypothetical protein